MSRRSEARARAGKLARRRDDVREATARFRDALEGAGGDRLSGKTALTGTWVLPIAAGAVGIAIAWSLRRLWNR